MIFGLTEPEWMRLPLAPRWQTVTTWEDVKDFEVREFDQSPRPSQDAVLSQLSTPNREPVGFRRTWFCELARMRQVPVNGFCFDTEAAALSCRKTTHPNCPAASATLGPNYWNL